MLLLQADNLEARFGDRVILDRLSASFEGGSMTAVIGKNGAGKTSMIRALAGRIRCGGSVRLLDRESGRRLPSSDIAYLPQLETTTSRLTVFEMVLLGLVRELRFRVNGEQMEATSAILEELKLTDLSDQPFHQLSGGQKQLVSMAQTFVSKPKALLLDEPTSALDLRHQLIVMELARDYARKTGAVAIVVVHDLGLAARYCDRLLLLDEGRALAYDTPERVLVPELLERVYKVRVMVERTSLGYWNVVPVAPL